MKKTEKVSNEREREKGKARKTEVKTETVKK